MRARSVLLAVLVSLFAAAPLAPRRAGAGGLDSIGRFFSGLNFISVEQEAQVSAKLAREVETKQRIVRDPAVNQYVNAVGQRLARALARREFRYRFRVVADRGINAFNVGGGYVYVHAGTLEAVGSEGEFAAVIAHEIGHQVQRHVAKAISRDQVFRTFASAALGRSSEWVQLAAGLGITTGQIFYGREAEREADAVMIDLMLASGYDPRQSLALFDRLRRIEGRDRGRVSAIFSSHPPTGERIERVRGQIARRRLPRGLDTDSRRFHQIQARLRGG